MSQTQDTSLDGRATEVDDLDVEGHGMREVAIGVSAAAIVASGAGAAFAMDGASSTKGTTQGIGGIVAAAESAGAGISSDVANLTGAAAETGGNTAHKAIRATDPITAQAQLMLADTHDVGQAAVDRVNQVANDPVEETDVIVDQAMKDARDLRDATKKTAEAQLSEAQAKAHDAATQAVTAAQQTASQAVTTTGTTAKTATDAANAAVAQASDTAKKALGEDAGVKVGHSGGTTTASVTAAGYTAEVSVG